MKQVWIAFDCLLNALLGGWGDETLSERAWRQHLKGNTLPATIINRIYFWQNNHCRGAYAAGHKRRKTAPEERDG